jgi:hypothetical protein
MKPDITGEFRPNIGWQTQTSQARFRLGKDKNEAERRRRRIEELWECVVTNWQQTANEGRPIWDATGLSLAHRLAKGETVFRIKPGAVELAKPTNDPNILEFLKWMQEEQQSHPARYYVKDINSLQRCFPCLTIVPDDPVLYAQGLKEGEAVVASTIDDLKSQGVLPQKQQAVLNAVGSLHQQIDRRIEAVKREYFDRTENHVSDSGNAKIRILERIKRFTDDIPLAQLDLAALDQILMTFRNRPMSERTGKPLKYGTCVKTITEFKDFLQWLDTLSGTGWEIPAKFAFLKMKVKHLESDEEEVKPVEVYDIPQLAILNRYATPIERMFFLLGLNCAYGADQSGRLKIREIHLDANPPQISRIRKKRGIRGKHLLWAQTIDGIKWVLANHKDPRPENFLLLNSNGLPYWRKTAGGNRATGITKHWRDLLKRVRKDHPDFPQLPFNSIRDTSVNLVRQTAGEELAQLQATHGHQSRDRNLRRYSNPRIRLLFRVLRKLERKLAPVFQVVADPWKQPKKQHTTHKQIDEIVALHEQGLTPNKIAAKLGVSHMTVRRRLGLCR